MNSRAILSERTRTVLQCEIDRARPTSLRIEIGACVPTIINKITTNTVEIASIRMHARALQSSVRPRGCSDDPNRRRLPIVRSDQGAEASRGPPPRPERLRQPRDFDGDPSRLVLWQHLRPGRPQEAAGEAAGQAPARHRAERAPVTIGATIFQQALQARPGGHRVEAAERAQQVRPVAGLDQGQEPGQPGDDPGTGSRVVNLSSRRWKNIRRLRGSECRRWSA
jgi:hypothetical protein